MARKNKADRRFDRIAGWTAMHVAKAWFFVFCLLTVAIWLPSFPFFKSLEAWQLPINTFTTVVTFLLVALLHNDQQRFEDIVVKRLNSIDRKLGRKNG